ncbi:glycosyltransferase family 4 protein [Ectothiorhodospira shaposhnikovii]|uniref:glycosyltransferase family 4 protein n=1 Tax=Ectothiorhodospira shaposhnikovii TaxID=1054 RepID=UPI0039A3BE11
MLSDLAQDLAARGMAVEVITSRLRYDDPDAALAPFEQVAGVSVFRVWSSRFGRRSLPGRAVDYVSFYVTAAWRLWRRAGRDAVVVAKTDPPMVSVMAAPVARLRGARLVNWLQDLFPEVASALGVRVARGPVLRLLTAWRNAGLRAADTNVVLGEHMAARVRAAGVEASRVAVIPNWADGEAIVPLARGENPLREAWGLADRFVVGYSGNLGRAHEFDTFLDAAERLGGRESVVFLFIGGGAQREAVEEAARARGLENVRFEPYQPRERLSESLGVADVHLVSLNPALEGLIVPSKFYGIAAAGRPTLFVGDVEGEIPRVLREAGCGEAVATGDGAGLAAWIARLADDADLCAAWGRNARAVLESRFDRRLAVEAWVGVL